MSRVVVLDSAAVEALALGDGRRVAEPRTRARAVARNRTRAALVAAHRLGRSVVIPTVVLAELYRDRSRNQAIDGLLARESGIELRDTDRWLARLVGGLLSVAGLGSEALVDAHVVAVAVEEGGGVCLTGDPDDLERIAAGSASVVVIDIGAV